MLGSKELISRKYFLKMVQIQKEKDVPLKIKVDKIQKEKDVQLKIKVGKIQLAKSKIQVSH